MSLDADKRRLQKRYDKTQSLSYKPKVKRRLNRVRFTLQTTFLLGFLALFLGTFHPASEWSFIERLMQLDPLPWLATALASHTWVRGAALALGMICAGLFIGRFFCSMICPLGALIDLSDWAIFKRLRGRRARGQWLTRFKNLKFWILAYLLLAAAFGHLYIHYFDPLAIVGRVLTLVCWPIATGLFFLGFESLKELAGAQGWQSLANAYVYAPHLALDLAALAMVAVVFAGQLVQSRFWCRNLCPVGALFGCLSRPAAVAGVVDETCIDCKICVHTCTMAAIGKDPTLRFGSECIQSNTCVTVCPTHSIAYVPRRRVGLLGLRWLANVWRHWRGRAPVDAPYVRAQPSIASRYSEAFGALPADARYKPRLTRRTLLRRAAVYGGATAVASVALGLLPRATSAQVLRPPGSVLGPDGSGDDFLDLCIRCDVCIKACTYNALVPMTLAEGGFANLWTPRFAMRQSACDTLCRACGDVCPTGAIAPLSLAAKLRERIGLAVVNERTCWLWNDRACTVCVDACQDAGYNAIRFYFAEGFQKIEVLAEACSGCGWCEYHCPEGNEDGTKSGPAAIVIEPLDASAFRSQRPVTPRRPGLDDEDTGDGPPALGTPGNDGGSGGFRFDDSGIDEDGEDGEDEEEDAAPGEEGAEEEADDTAPNPGP